jgi:Mat/Ecp fimbriae outer membrane usher protein
MTALTALRRPLLTRSLALCCTALAGLAPPDDAHAQQPQAPAILVGEPEGFANLTEEQTLIVDVFFGKVRRGEAVIKTLPGEIAFADPASLLDLLPPLEDRTAVAAVIGAPRIAANAQLACSLASDPARCGRLSPEIAGVIFDRNNFRVDIFVNPTFLAVQDGTSDVYLPAPQDSLSVINSLGAVVSGRFGEGETLYNVNDSLVVGVGTRRIRADLSYATDHGFQADTLVLEWDRPGLRYSAGALWAPGTDLAGRRKLIGFGIESQTDTRRDRDEMSGSPIVVYLDQRARVDVLREGRVLNSAIYEAGNQRIDTANLPDGSYDIVLRIDEPGRPVREERRFFTKSRQIPSRGRTDFFAFAGLGVKGYHRGSLRPSDDPHVGGGIIHRLSESWAVSGGVEANGFGAAGEVAVTLLTDTAQVRAAAVADLDDRYGAALQLSSSGTSRLNFTFDLRHLHRPRLAAPPQDGSFGTPGSGYEGRFHSGGYGGSYSQIGGLVSYSLNDVRVLATLLYRDDEFDGARYSIGPSVEWDVLRQGPIVFTLRGDMTVTERGESGFAGVSLRLFGGNASVTALAGARASSIAGDGVGDGAIAAVAGSWSPGFAGGNLSLGAGFERQPEQENVSLSSEYRHRLGSLAGDIVHSEIGANSVTQYALGFQTSFAAGAGTVRVAGKTTSDSLIVARAQGAREHDTFEVLVNDQVAGTIEGTRALTLALPPYRAYNLRIRPTGADLMAYDSSLREVGLYPGSVSRLEWEVAPVTIRIGRLLHPDGSPLRRASISGKGVWAESDEEGYFQIEAPETIDLEVTTRDGRRFALTLPAGEPKDGIARLGAVVCCERRDVFLGSLDGFPGLFIGDDK